MTATVAAQAAEGLVDWFTFSVAALTAIAALVAVGYTAVTHRRAVDNERKSQASKVGIWVENTVYHSNASPPRYDAFEVVVHNGSDLPVHDVRVDRLPLDWTEDSESVEAVSVSVVVPGTESPYLPFSGFVGSVRMINGIPDPPPLRVWFRDNAGVRWRREPDGKLTEVDG